MTTRIKLKFSTFSNPGLDELFKLLLFVSPRNVEAMFVDEKIRGTVNLLLLIPHRKYSRHSDGLHLVFKLQQSLFKAEKRFYETCFYDAKKIDFASSRVKGKISENHIENL